MVDRVHFADRLGVVALGNEIDGTKQPPAVEESTGNTTVVCDLLVGCATGAWMSPRPVLAVLDGAEASPPGVRAVFDQPIWRSVSCTRRNVKDKLPEKVVVTVTAKMAAAYPMNSAPGCPSRRGDLGR